MAKKGTMAAVAVLATCAGTADGRKITLSVKTADLHEFREAARLAVELGANHLTATQIEPSMWAWNVNRHDPYPNWGLQNPTVFKFVVPDELKAYLPEDYARRNLDTLKGRAAILREFGLKASFNGMEPAYLPERVYLDHPEWRGPRCDQARRARSEYYAPCLDNPEMYAIYHKAVVELCRACPFDAFSFLTNDSGGGLCWCEGLYPGRNGPAACRDIPVGLRISRFLSLFQDAACEAGLGNVEADVQSIHPSDMAQALALLKPGQSVNNHTATSAARTVAVGVSGYGDHTFPVFLLPRLGAYARMMQTAQNATDANLGIVFRSLEDKEAIRFVAKWFGKMKPGPAGRADALMDLATEFAGETEEAAGLAEIWDIIERMEERLDHLETGGHVFLLGTVCQRWLTRPFVAFPAELRPEEKTYYRQYQFQAQTEADADNMVDLQANCWLQGYGAANLVEKNAARVLELAGYSIAIADEIAARGGPYAAKAKILSARLRAYRCLVRNACNAVRFQDLMDRTDREKPPVDTSPAIDEQGDIQLYKVNQLVRDEIDNTLELIHLIETTPAKVIETAHAEEFACSMMLEPDLVASLRRKIAIMEAHRRDFLRLYKSYNK
jgi:hypothetical protein